METYSRCLATQTPQRANRKNVRQALSTLSAKLALITHREIIETDAVELIRWLSQTYELRHIWPVNVMIERVIHILDEGYLSEDELIDLIGVLSALIEGAELKHPGLQSFTPRQSGDVVIIPGHRFCFSGKFIYGSRERCKQAIVERGGLCSKQISSGLNYLVVGELGNKNRSRESKKLRRAEQLHERGIPVQIVPESLWVSAL